MNRKIIAFLISLLIPFSSYSAMQFDANTFVDTLYYWPSAYTSVTFSLWFQTIAGKDYNTIGNNMLSDYLSIGNGGNGADMELYLYQNKVGWYVRDTTLNNMNPVSAANQYIDQKWHHVAATVSGQTAYLYVDGILVDSKTNSSFTSDFGGTSLATIAIAANCGKNTANYYLGNLDDVRIYNRALSLTEVQSLYFSHTRIRMTDSLVRYFPLDDGTDGKPLSNTTLANGVRDRSGFNQNGTSHGNASLKWLGSTGLRYP